MIDDELLASARLRLVEQGDLTTFAELAGAAFQSDDDDPARAAQLEQLLREVVNAFVGLDGPDSAARAIDEYVAVIWPLRLERGLGPDCAEQIASEAEVSGRLRAETTLAFRNAGSPADQPATQQGWADHENVPIEQLAMAEGVDFAQGAGQNLEQLYESLTRKSPSRMRKVLLVGQSTSGKTFLLARLQDTAATDFSFSQYGRLGDPSATHIDRSKDVTVWRLSPRKQRFGLLLFDIPGEFFRSLTSSDPSKLRVDDRKSMYALLAAADALIIVEPAFHTLALDEFADNGDDIENHGLEVALARRQADINEGKSPPSEEKIRSAFDSGRKTRVAAHKSFEAAFEIFARTIAVLRECARQNDALASPEKLKAMIDEFVANYDFTAIAERPVVSLDIPALLLLSRADEYGRRMNLVGEDYDKDPMLKMLEKASRRFIFYSERFDAFAVDFLTAQEMCPPEPEYDEGLPHYGFTGLLTEWLLPAIGDAKCPPWLRPFSVGRWLRHPARAIGLRRRLDPAFDSQYQAGSSPA